MKRIHKSFALPRRCIVVDVEVRDVVQVPDPCVWPTLRKLWFSEDLITLPSVPHWGKCALDFISTSQCVSNLVVMLLPGVPTESATTYHNHRCAVVWCLQTGSSRLCWVASVFRTCRSVCPPEKCNVDMMDIDSKKIAQLDSLLNTILSLARSSRMQFCSNQFWLVRFLEDSLHCSRIHTW